MEGFKHILTVRSDMHIIPIGGKEPVHDAGPSCWCHPTDSEDERTRVWIHNAEDCREARERLRIPLPADEKWIQVYGVPVDKILCKLGISDPQLTTVKITDKNPIPREATLTTRPVQPSRPSVWRRCLTSPLLAIPFYVGLLLLCVHFKFVIDDAVERALGEPKRWVSTMFFIVLAWLFACISWKDKSP